MTITTEPAVDPAILALAAQLAADPALAAMTAELATRRITMTTEVAAALRAPFKPEHMGKLPKITCGKCRGSRSRPNPNKVCDEHRKARCAGCRNWITTEHMHLDYVGHAEVTDRLIEVDPLWTWEPMAFGADGLPALDPDGGLWIRLTVAGVTKIGYGDAGLKQGPDAMKERIGDAIRNGAMRFGVALDLWGATFKAAEDDAEASLRAGAPEIAEDDWEHATPVHGRGRPPVDEPQASPAPRPPARPVSATPPSSAYNPALYTLGVQHIEQATTAAALDVVAGNIATFAAQGQISEGEAGRLRLKLAERRDQLNGPPALPDALADQAQTTAQN